jgi:ribosomal silencing factor RsfS
MKASAPSKPSLRCAFSTSRLAAKDRNDPSAKDPEFSFLEDGVKSPISSPEAADEENAESITPINSEDEPPVEPAQSRRATSPKDESVPWYLQRANAPDLAPRPIEVPDLPPNPPPLLKTILEYVSMTAGLDDIELLDLRHLDPPPALGPKLIMIIATARSEKHLHVSADRFSRFLRREHGLKANAAGLLGRNELKIKLRRKAKRMRMLANVGGAVPEGNIDDGIRTGWICCTLSKIEAHPDDMHMPGDDVQEFVGFRDVKPGVNVVVQMFTEEKRHETDLETLWGGVLRTSSRQAKAADETLKELEEDIEDLDNEDTVEVEQEKDLPTQSQSTKATSSGSEDIPEPKARPSRTPPSTPSDFFPPASQPRAARQLRRLHTVGLR